MTIAAPPQVSFLAERVAYWAQSRPDEEAVRYGDRLWSWAEWYGSRLAAYKCPWSLDILGELPRNPSGKTLKRDLRKPYWENRDRKI